MGKRGRIGTSRGKGLTPNQAKRRWRKEKRKLQNRIDCEEVRKAWDDKQTAIDNCKRIGLALDPNVVIPLKKGVDDNTEEMETVETSTISELRKNARPSELPVFVSLEERKFYDYLIKTYGDDYQKMVRDPRNVDQRTTKQLKRQIARYQLWLERKQVDS